VFELVNSSGTYTEKVLYSFTNYPDGRHPFAGLIMDSSGNLYGTTDQGGTSNNDGTVFELVNSSGTYNEALLLLFGSTCGINGIDPLAGLVMDSSGNLYGTTFQGGTSNNGTVFALTHLSGPAVATMTTVTSSVNPATAGDSVVLTAEVSPGLGTGPTGFVNFSVSSMSLGSSQPVVCGQASLTVDAVSIGIGTLTVTAQYNPAVAAWSSSSGSLSQTVNESGVAVTNGSNTFNGNQTINGNVTASGDVSGTEFFGSGAGLTNVTAATATTATTAANALLLNGLPSSAFQPAGSYASLTGPNIFAGDQNITGNLMLTGTVNGGAATFTGLVMPSLGTATSSQGYNSNALDTAASVFNSTAAAAQNQLFRWQAEPSSNNTAAPSATLNLLFGANGATPTETGLSVNANGIINFASGQTFPGSSGTGAITGVTAGTGLTGGGTSGNVTLSLNTSFTGLPYLPLTGGTLTGGLAAPSFTGNGSGLTSLNPANISAGTAAINISGNAATATLAATATTATAATTATTAANATDLGGVPAANYAQLEIANSFTGNQTVTGNVTVSGAVTGGTLAVGGGTAIKEYVSVTDSITLPALTAGSCTTFKTAAVTGFTPGTSDTIGLGIPSALVNDLGTGVFLIYQAWETSTAESPTITIQVCNPTGARYRGGTSGTLRIDVFKH
jgi:uncharacterized repeat protein (TIGR03803 family)